MVKGDQRPQPVAVRSTEDLALIKEDLDSDNSGQRCYLYNTHLVSILGASRQAHTETQQVLRLRTLSASIEQPKGVLCPERSHCVEHQMTSFASS